MTDVRPVSSRATVFERGAWVHVAVLHLITWLIQGTGLTNDSFGYLQGIDKLATGTVSYYPPGYSIFLAPIAMLFPHSTGFAVAGVQHLCMVLSLVALQQVMRPVLGPQLSAAGLVLSGSVGPTLFLPQMIMSDNVALFGMTGTLWFAARSDSRCRRVDEVAAGASLALATLARVIPFVVVGLPMLLINVSRHLRVSARRAFRVLAVGAALGGLVPLWNAARSGTFAIANSTGRHLYNRVAAEQGLVDRRGRATNELLGRVRLESLRHIPHWEIAQILSPALSEEQTDSLLGRVAVEGLRAHPFAFAGYSARLAWRQYRAAPTFVLQNFSEQPLPTLERAAPSALRSLPWHWWHLFTAGFATLWPALLWMPLVGLLLLKRLPDRSRIVAIALVPSGYLLATAQLEAFDARYSACVLPFALALAPTPIAALIAWRSDEVQPGNAIAGSLG